MSKVPRSPTALDRTVDLSQPEWKRELIRQKNLRKRSLIRLPTLMIERERKISAATNGDPISPAPTTAPDAKPPKHTASTNPEGMNGFPRSKSSITLNNNNNQSIKSLPNVRSQSFENDIQIISSRQPESNGKWKQPQQNNTFSENSVANNFNQGSFSGRKTPPPPTSPTSTWQQFLNKNKDADRYKSGDPKVEMKNGGFELSLEFAKNNGMNGNIEDYGYEGDDNDSVNDYGPGIVNRMRAKFINLISAQPEPPPVPMVLNSPASPVPIMRQASSLEDLLDIESGDELEDRSELGSGFVARKKDYFKHNANAVKSAFNFLTRARSMDLLTNVDHSPYIDHNQLKKAATGSKKIIIIEHSKPSEEETLEVDSSAKKVQRHSVPDFGRSLSPNLINSRHEDVPIPKSVLECVRLFQQTDEAKYVYSRPLYDNNNSSVVTAVKVPPPVPPPLPTQASKPKKPSVIILEEKVIQKHPPPKQSPQSNVIANDDNKLLENEQSSSVKFLRETFETNAQPLRPNFSSASPEPVIKIEKPKVVTEIPKPLPKPTISTAPFKELEEVPPSLPKTKPPVAAVGQQQQTQAAGAPKPNQTQQTKTAQLMNGYGGGINTILIEVKGDKENKPYLPEIDDEETFVPKITPHYLEHISSGGRDRENGGETDDVMGESLHSKSVNFIGANIIVGRSSLLKTRNKKLQLLFDDKALSTFEYPSEWTLLNERSDDNEDCDNTPNILKSDEPKRTNNSPPTANGGISNYTPMALSKDQVFELGMSPVSQIETTRSMKMSTDGGHPQENGDLELSIKPGDECENVFWSNTQTVDILF